MLMDPRSNLFDMSLDMPPIPLPDEGEGSHMLSDDVIEVPDFPAKEASTSSLHLKLADSPPVQPADLLPPPTAPKSQNVTSFFSAPSWLPSVFASSKPVSPQTLLDAQAELIASLREELSVQTEITSQYAIDLDSRDEFIDILCARVEVAETELELCTAEEEEQYAIILSFKKQLASLERALKKVKLDADANASTSSFGGDQALREKIRLLEEEANERAEALANAREDLELLRANASREDNGDDSAVLRLMDERDELREEVARLQKAEADREDQSNVDANTPPNAQMKLLQEELEAQWERTEKASEELQALRKENSELKTRCAALQDKNTEDESFVELEQMNQELATQLNDILATQQALEEERDQISEELRASQQHVEDLMQSHSDLQRKLEQTEQEHVFAIENATRLQTAMDSRATEIQALEDERQAHFAELDSLHSRLSTLDKEHARQLADRARHISDLEIQLQLMQTESERTVRMVNESADRDIYLASVEDKAEQRREECERLRRRCHELEQESAAREVRLLELSKDADRVRDDNMNLNIALDSKQQELELIKRKLGVKGTGGATPAPSRTMPFGTTPKVLTGLNKTMNSVDTPGTAMKTPRPKSSLSSSTMARTKNGNDAKMGPPTITRPPRQSIGSPTPLAYARPPSRAAEGRTGQQTSSLRRASYSSHTDNDFDFEFGMGRDEDKENQAQYLPLSGSLHASQRQSHMMMVPS